MRRMNLGLDPTDAIALVGLITTAIGVGIVAGFGAALIVVGLAFVAYAIAASVNTPSPPST